MRRALQDCAAVRHAARPVCRVDHHKLVARGDAAAGRLFERHADDGLPARDGGQDRAGALQLLPVKIFGKGLQNFIRFARKRAEHRDQRRIARAGDRRVGKGDLSRKLRPEQIGPAGDIFRADKLGIVDKDERQRRKRRPDIVLRAVLRQNRVRIRAGVGRKQVPIRFQTLHAAAEHHVRLRRVGLCRELLEQLVGAALDHRDPYAGPRLKFLDDRLPDLFFM